MDDLRQKIFNSCLGKTIDSIYEMDYGHEKGIVIQFTDKDSLEILGVHLKVSHKGDLK